MKYVLKRSALAVAALVSTTAAFAQSNSTTAAAPPVVITFDAGLDLTNAPFAPMIGAGDALVQGDYQLTGQSNTPGASSSDLVGNLVDGTQPATTCTGGMVCPSGDPSTYYTGVNDGFLLLDRAADSTQFYVKDFKGAFVANGLDQVPSMPGLITLQGFLADGTSLSQSFQLSGPTSNGYLRFSQFTTSGAFATTAFDHVNIFGSYCDAAGNCTSFTNDKGQFAIDDIRVAAAPTAAVPEPASLGLMALGLVGIAAASRRRRAD